MTRNMNPLLSNNWMQIGLKKSNLRWNLAKAEKAIEFQVTYQDPKVTSLLTKLAAAGQVFQASNGLRITSHEFPEFKDSTNMVFLRGNDIKLDNKVDNTNFHSNVARDSKFNMLNEALLELCEVVRTLDSQVQVNINPFIGFGFYTQQRTQESFEG